MELLHGSLVGKLEELGPAADKRVVSKKCLVEESHQMVAEYIIDPGSLNLDAQNKC